MHNEIIITNANLLDHSEVLKLLIKWFDESLIDGVPKVCAFTGIWLSDMIANQIVLIATLNQEIVGTLGLKMGFFPWNNQQKVIFADFIMTEPTKRHLKVADKLIKEAKNIAESLKLTLVAGHFTGRYAELKDKYLEKMHGFTYGGSNFFYKGV